MKVIYMIKLLNNTSKKQLTGRRASLPLRNPKEFSIIFLGDSHVGMNIRKNPTCKYQLKNYKSILKSIDSNDNTLIAVFNGGDGGHNGDFVEKFAAVTSNLMNNKPYKIPFFSAVGNHEYIHDHSLNEYKSYISKKENDVIKLYGKNFGPKVAVIMLNTGRLSSNRCSKGSRDVIKNSINKIKNDPIYKSVINDKSVKIIIDMHVPPPMPVFMQPQSSHLWCPQSQEHFSQFIKSIKASRILAIVTHHKHGFIQPEINSQYYFLNKIPVFLTAQGGNCDPVSSSDLRAKYSYYKIHLSTKTPRSRDNYTIKSVHRLDVNVSKSKVSKEVKIY